MSDRHHQRQANKLRFEETDLVVAEAPPLRPGNHEHAGITDDRIEPDRESLHDQDCSRQRSGPELEGPSQTRY